MTLPDSCRIVIGVDPGTEQTAWVKYNRIDKKLLAFGLVKNVEMIKSIRSRQFICEKIPVMAVESVASYGMSVGASVFETCVWIGRFIEAFETSCRPDEKPLHRRLYRREEKIHLCGTMKAKDSNIRQSIMDRYGSSREVAIGTKNKPGPLYGVSADIWSALAVAITASETAGEWISPS